MNSTISNLLLAFILSVGLFFLSLNIATKKKGEDSLGLQCEMVGHVTICSEVCSGK